MILLLGRALELLSPTTPRPLSENAANLRATLSLPGESSIAERRGVNPAPELLTLATNLIGTFGYVGLGAAHIVAAPELILPLAGFMVAQGDLSFAWVLVASLIGALLGQLTIYLVARAFGERRVRDFLRRYGRGLLTSESDLDRVLRLFSRYQPFVLSLGRAVPTVRSLISVPAGLQRVPLWRFVLLTVLGTALWNSLLLLAGMLVGRNWRQLAALLETYGTVVLVLLGLGVGALLIRRFRAQVVRWRKR